ncbi:MAG: DUF6951 family protein [Candidatus Hecatellaceae archaeon]
MDAGNCGFKAKIRAETQGSKIKVKTVSSCGKVRKWAEKLGEELGATEITLPVNENPVYQAADRETSICPPCPVPPALLLAVWVEAGYALRKTPQLTFKSE